MEQNIIEVKHLSKSFGTHEVLRDIDFAVKCFKEVKEEMGL